MAVFLLDTTALIDHLRGRQEVQRRMQDLTDAGHFLATCAVTVAELFSHLRPADEAGAKTLLDGLLYRDIPRDAAERAGRFRYALARRGRMLSAPDALIGSLAMDLEATLLTKNVADFATIPGLAVEELPVEG